MKPTLGSLFKIANSLLCNHLFQFPATKSPTPPSIIGISQCSVLALILLSLSDVSSPMVLITIYMLRKPKSLSLTGISLLIFRSMYYISTLPLTLKIHNEPKIPKYT